MLTDLYVQRLGHSGEEERRYTELALGLLAAVDVSTRVAIAGKLAAYPQAPRAVIRSLARDVFEVAEPVLIQSPCITSDDLLGIIEEFDPRYATAIARRNPADRIPRAPHVPTTVTTGREGSAAASAATIGRLHIDAAGQSADDGTGAAREIAVGPEFGEFFLTAGPAERRLLIEDPANAGTGPLLEPLPSAPSETVKRLEAAALEHKTESFVRELEQSLRISRATARRIVHDDSGEPVLVAARALGMPADVLLRIILFLNPVIGESVRAVFTLVDLYERLTPEVATRLVASWRALVPGRDAALSTNPSIGTTRRKRRGAAPPISCAAPPTSLPSSRRLPQAMTAQSRKRARPRSIEIES